MAPQRSFLDRSAAQKLVDPAIRRAIALHGLTTRLETAPVNSTGLGALPADEDVDIDDIRRQAQDNAHTINSYQQQLLDQDDQRIQHQEMQRQLDDVLAGLSTQGTLPDVARSKAHSQAQRIACLQYLADTEKDASPEERAKFPGLVAAAQEPERLVPGEKYSEEHITWALGSDTMVKDFWTIDEVFQALVSARRIVDAVDLQNVISQTVDGNFAIVSSTLQRIDTTGQETAQANRRLEHNMQIVVDALGPPDGGDLKRRRPSVQFANTAGATITRPSTAPPGPSVTPRRTLPTRQSSRISSFNQIPPSLQNRTPVAGQAASTGLSAASSAEPESPAEPETALDTAQRLSIDQVPSNVQDNTVVDDVVNNIIVWDGSACFPMADLDAEVITQLRSQVQEMLCPMTMTSFHITFVANVNRPGIVCVWQRCFLHIFARSSKSNNGYFACPECIAARRICLVRVRQPKHMVNTKPHVAPLPESVRPEDAIRTQLAYYVLPELEAAAYTTAYAAAAALEQQSSDPTSPAQVPQTTNTSSERRSSRLSLSRTSLSSSHSPSHTSPGQTSPAQPSSSSPTTGDPDVISGEGPAPETTTGNPPASSTQPAIEIKDYKDAEDVFSNILAWDGRDLFPMEEAPAAVVDDVKASIAKYLVNLAEGKFHNAFVASVNKPGMACVWQRSQHNPKSDPNGYHACKDCVAMRRVCVIRARNQTANRTDRPHMAPLPDNIRPANATRADPEYWALPAVEETSAES